MELRRAPTSRPSASSAAGFVEVETWLEPRPTTLEDPEPFVRTVCLVRHLDLLPAELHRRFIDAVLARAGTPLVLDYVRLNMVARRGAVRRDDAGARGHATWSSATRTAWRR